MSNTSLESDIYLYIYRSNVKRVLAEVTGHMEQQYSNQRYLDKLRADNEAMALLEKERQVHVHYC